MNIFEAVPRKLDILQMGIAEVVGAGTALVPVFEGGIQFNSMFWIINAKSIIILIVCFSCGAGWLWTTRMYALDGFEFRVIRWCNRKVLLTRDIRDVAAIERVARKRFGLRSGIVLTWSDGSRLRMPEQYAGIGQLLMEIYRKRGRGPG